ncbi:MAG: ATP-binding protein [Comamonadaceae bacterium]|jgi:two-component system, NtrC family, sensor histidine kinase PilS
MHRQPDAKSWFDPSMLETSIEAVEHPQEFERLWRGFMTARVMLGLALLAFQGVVYELGSARDSTLVLFCAAYCVVALGVRLKAGARPLGEAFDAQWILIVGVDILAVAALQVTHGDSVNYTPLFALPILMVSVLGSLLLSMACAALVTLMLLLYAGWASTQVPAAAAAHFLQAALTGVGCFSIAFLANQIAIRLTNVEQRAQRNQLAVRLQRQVNELVIESMTDGILVLDQGRTVRAANPAACQMLGMQAASDAESFNLAALAGWQGLVDLVELSFSENSARQADVVIHHAGQGPLRLHARTRLTATPGDGGQTLCVMFLRDQREMEARMRTEKLASMGRMSAAVAHEIRNPLAAIVQANALLDEDIALPRHRQLTQMVRQNAARLGKIVEEVLEVSRVRRRDHVEASDVFVFNELVAKVCADWQEQAKNKQLLRFDLAAVGVSVRFQSEHLRRVLVNLLDNASRYCEVEAGAIEVATACSMTGQAALRVWNGGPPLDQSVQRHLFEPFFSSESRSSGLGLYICRELCEEQGASISYCRSTRKRFDAVVEGNEFRVSLQTERGDSERHLPT